MIRISQIKLPINHSENDLVAKITKKLNIKENNIVKYEIYKKSIDARKKPQIFYVYSVDVYCDNEKKLNKKILSNDVMFAVKKKYKFTPDGDEKLELSPVVIGMGPAGLFCAYMLAKQGFKPIVLERGRAVNDRIKDVEKFWETGVLDTKSNVQFGEGGAGTFSDGKLNTLVNDKNGRNQLVLEIFSQFGAKEEILYTNKPHIGTDVLAKVVENMRNEMISLGADVRFESQVTDFIIEDNKLKGVVVNDSETIATNVAVLAPGHSARDTFYKIYEKGFLLEPKNFAVGVRVEHPQELIDRHMFGDTHENVGLMAADYKLTGHAQNERNVFSFCMCPGGYVVNASSEEGMTAVNGMSYSMRDGKNANSAIIVSVTKEDYEGDSPLAGVEFQRKLEKAAFEEGDGKIPVQLFGDFKANRKSKAFGDITPSIKGEYAFGNLKNVFPNYINDALEECIEAFGRNISGYNREDTVMSGVESRTSSPVRICRDEEFESNIKGIYPCGEGAGYAGGITSAAMDGIKVFEAIARKYTV